MTMIHQCTRCGYQGRVVETAEAYLCEPCYDAQVEHNQSETDCPCCGAHGVTDIGVCYACENAGGPFIQGFIASWGCGAGDCPHEAGSPEAVAWEEGSQEGKAVRHQESEQVGTEPC